MLAKHETLLPTPLILYGDANLERNIGFGTTLSVNGAVRRELVDIFVFQLQTISS